MENHLTRNPGAVFQEHCETILETIFPQELLERAKRKIRRTFRERKFTFTVMVWLGLFSAAFADTDSMQKLLHDLWGRVMRKPGQPGSQPGWSRAKLRLDLATLKWLWKQLVERVLKDHPEVGLFHGLRLVAVDCTAVNLPEMLWSIFGSKKGDRGDGPAQAKVCCLQYVGTRIPFAFRLGKAKDDDRKLFKRLINSLNSKTLVLMDKGFYSIEVFALLGQAQVPFLTRMKSNGKPKLLKRLGKNDGLYEITASAYWKNKPHVPASMVVRIVHAHCPGFRPMRLVTNLLDWEKYPAVDIAGLYHQRWHIETYFREMKKDCKIEHWHSRSAKGVVVEFYFHFLLVTAVRVWMADSVKGKRLKPGLLSFRRCLEICVREWLNETPREEILSELSRQEIDVRPGRRFERSKQKRRKASRRKTPEQQEALAQQGVAA